MPLLVADKVTKRFGGLQAVRTLDFELDEGAIVSVIGPNGAGKTTFFNCIAGFYQIDEGSLVFDGQHVERMRPDQIADMGIARTYQNIRLFTNVTALENVLIGQHRHLRSSWIASVIGTRGVREEERQALDEARRLLNFCGLR